MQREPVFYPANGDRFIPEVSSDPFASPDQHPCLTNGGDYLGLYPSPIFSLSPGEASHVSASLTPSSSIDEEDCPTATASRLFLARLTLQNQEITDRYALCLNHFQDAAEEAETLRLENAQLRIANVKLKKRLGLLTGMKHNSLDATPVDSIADELRRLRLGDDLPAMQRSLGSALGMQENRLARPGVEERIPLPKSISIRSSGYLKLNPSGGAVSASNRNSRLRVSTPLVTGPQRVYVGSSTGKDAASGEEALEFEVCNQGMFKTELCNKWEESGECPYGDHCQFAHGIAELRPVIRHPRYKTEICRMVLAGEPCPYGHRCHFRHTLSTNERSLLHPS